MELLFVTVIGASLGLIARYLLPSRGTYGALLLPAVSGVATAVVWVALLWVGLTFDGTWIWVASLAAAVIVGRGGRAAASPPSQRRRCPALRRALRR